MARLGSPITKKFQIGTAELRLGPLSLAGKLEQQHSVGLIDAASVTITQNSVDLEGGFPRILIDTQIVSQSGTITATLREFSRRNLNVLLGEGIPTTPVTRVATTVSAATAVGDTTVTVATGAGANFAAGDMVVIYAQNAPENVSVCRVASIAADVLTLDAGTPVLFALDPAVDTIHLYKADAVPIGAITTANYFSVQLLVQDLANNGAPIGYNVWKGTISSGLTYNTSSTDYGSTDLEIKLLQPAATEYAAGAPLNHLANVIPTNPTGMFFGGGD